MENEIKKIKPTDINIAKYFDVSTATLRNWKKGSIEKQRCYRALKEFFLKEQLLNESEWSKSSQKLASASEDFPTLEEIRANEGEDAPREQF